VGALVLLRSHVELFQLATLQFIDYIAHQVFKIRSTVGTCQEHLGISAGFCFSSRWAWRHESRAVAGGAASIIDGAKHTIGIALSEC
jgi:hypothetical protein